MTDVDEMRMTPLASLAQKTPEPLLAGFRGIGQVFFQENALTGALFLVGIAVSSPLMAVGAAIGSAIGTATAWVLKFDKTEVLAGIYGFNSDPGRHRDPVLLPAGTGEHRAPDRRLRRHDVRDPADASVRTVPDVHHAVHRHHLGDLLSGAGPGCFAGRAGDRRRQRSAFSAPWPMGSAR